MTVASFLGIAPVDLRSAPEVRELLIVSSDDDPYSADAADLVERARPAFVAAGFRSRLAHLRVKGPHALDVQRYDAIVEWLVARASIAG